MRIKSKDILSKRIRNAIETLSEDENYPESLTTLNEVEYEMNINDFEEKKRFLSDILFDDDKTRPMHPEVIKLLMDICSDGVEEGDSDYMRKLGSLYFTDRIMATDYYHMAEKYGKKYYKKVFNYLVKDAAKGNVCSLYLVGDFYRNGFYVKKDPKEAFHIYISAVMKCFQKS